MRGVHAQIQKGNYTAPPPSIDIDVMQAFTTVDIASENCAQVLSELMSNNTDRDANDNTASAGIGGADFGTM